MSVQDAPKDPPLPGFVALVDAMFCFITSFLPPKLII